MEKIGKISRQHLFSSTFTIGKRINSIKPKKGILILTPSFSPNIGGVETHLDDLVKELSLQYNVYVHTYFPFTTAGVPWKPKEDYKNVIIRRYRWFGKSLFHRIEKTFWVFLYLGPWLGIRTFLFMVKNHRKIDLIHAQGLICGAVGVVLKKIFHKPLIISTHAIYEIATPKMRFIFRQADIVLTQSDASKNELAKMGIRSLPFRYWLNFNTYRPKRFTVLFVGRWLEKKGYPQLMEVAKQLEDIDFVFATGIESKYILHFYQMADVVCIPSQYEEGFSRVAMEALACGVPVVASNLGTLPEVLNSYCAVLVEPTVENLKRAIMLLYTDKKYYENLKNNCRNFAIKNFNLGNLHYITDAYGLLGV